MDNKKGSLADAIYVPLYLLVIAITIILSVYIWGQISTNIEPMMNTTAPEVTTGIANINTGFQSLDYMFPFLVGGLLVVSLVFAFKSGANVIYAILSFIFWIFAIFISAIFTNIFDSFVLNFPTTQSQFPIIYYIIMNIKWLILGWVFLISIVMFTRNKKEEGQSIQSVEAFTQ